MPLSPPTLAQIKALASGLTLDKDGYKFVRFLNKGGCGIVVQVSDMNGNECVLKTSLNFVNGNDSFIT